MRLAGFRPYRVAIAVLLGMLAVSRTTLADVAIVPFGLQAELFVKVADYDRTLTGRTQGLVRVVS